MTTYLATTFSPMMLGIGGPDGQCRVRRVKEKEFLRHVRKGFLSVVGHENTARLLSKRLGAPVDFRRGSIKLRYRDIVLVATPNFRVDETREFSDEEIEAAEFSFFLVRL